ncbi:CHAT domain-containing protein [Pontibacter lucknowensis]|uniref:CHAT domain-containing protein n=1 Tax=Pontibacter lucknowensis TaxID=1077936 RepID=A0A1N6TIS2_9BACT|nr:CHAT domain-containing protein [Pontibacter lucknowensis]SIQ53243.1 CHAT domain-containing protein [Pontibacter lucknowensis]
MVGRLISVGVVSAILLAVYLLVSVIHLVWTYVNPEGFWSFQYFVDLFRTALFLIILTLVTLGFLYILAHSIYITVLSLFKEGIERPNILSIVGFGVGYLLIMIVNWIWVMGFSLDLNKNMADKYSYIQQSDKLIDEGKFAEATDYAKNAYQKAQANKIKRSRIFVLTNLYLDSEWAKEQALSAEFAATINYAYCLQKSLQSLELAESLNNQALKLSDLGALKNDVSNKIPPTLSLAQIYLARGQYAEAEEYFNSLLSISNQSAGDVMSTISAYMQFAIYNHKIGNSQKAAQLKISALELWENNEMSLKSTAYLLLLVNAISSEIELGHMDRAGELILKANDLADDRKNKAIYLDFLTAKGVYCLIAANQEEGVEEVIDYSLFYKIVSWFSPDKRSLRDKFAEESESCFIKVVEETESRFGKESPAYAKSLTWLGTAYTQHSKFEKAGQVYNTALNLLHKTKAVDQERYYTALLYSLTSDFYSNNRKHLDKPIREVEEHYFRKLSINYLFLTEEEKEYYIANAESGINMINSIYINVRHEDFIQRLYDNILATKNIALFSNQNIRGFVSNSQNQKLYNAYHELIKEKEILDTSRQSINPDLFAERETKLKLEEKDILKQISTNPSFVSFNPREIKWTDIRAALKDSETSIEIINVPSKPYSKDSIEYFALITKNTYTQPKLVPLFMESDLLQLLNQPGNTQTRINSIYQKHRENLYNKIWSPLDQYLKGSSKVYVSVSGALHKVSLPSILLDYPAEIVYLSSTRQIATIGEAKLDKRVAALFGDVDYDHSFDPVDASSKSLVSNAVAQGRDGSNFATLAYTADEIKSIGSILKQNTSNRVDLYNKDGASEEALRKLSNSNVNLLHIASHGFYFHNTTSMAVSNLILPTDVITQYEGNPLKRSGIVLAGANLRSTQKPENDGIITAQEISQLDLSNIDLVVLSACETGLGDIKGSEGVYGLQRAFKLAGAKSTLVSLWKVPDLQTSELMTYFYQYLEAGISKSEALRKAQIQIKSQYDLPFYWAGFILIEA